jgi:hypothetical protein
MTTELRTPIVLSPLVHLLANPTPRPSDPDAIETAASEIIRGRAMQILDLDYRNPMAFELIQEYLDDAQSAATAAIEARGEAEFFRRSIAC